MKEYLEKRIIERRIWGEKKEICRKRGRGGRRKE
jgi:hypothetical protein